MGSGVKSMKADQITGEITSYKRKFYINQLIKGLLITVGFILTIYVLLTTLEFFGRMGSIPRTFMFFGFMLLVIGLSYRYIFQPLLFLFHLRNGISDADAAKKIGSYFPAISDRLLNYLQLKSISDQSNALVEASLQQRSKEFSTFTFTSAIDYRENRSYAKYLLPSIIVAISIAIFIPQVFTTGTQRIVSFSEEFAPVAPFDFNIEPSSLMAFKNEDHLVQVTLTGPGIPQSAYVIRKERRIKMANIGPGVFEYLIPKIQTSKIIQLEAAGYLSKKFTINVVNRPNLKNFNVFLTYPQYLGKTNERVENIGNLIVPQGTLVKWQFNTIDTDGLIILLLDSSITINTSEDNLYEYEYEATISTEYSLRLTNEYSTNKDLITYKLNVVPDEFPTINLNTFQDTVLYSYLILGGNISDDYGLTALHLNYTILDKNDRDKISSSIQIPILPGQNNQRYFHQWDLDSVNFVQGDKIKYYTQVWDNDGVSGIKSSKSGSYTFKMPTKEEIAKDIDKSTEKTTSDLEESIKEAKELQKELKEIEERLRGKKLLEWQDEKRIEELLKKREDLDKAVEELQKQFNKEKQKKDRFQQQNEEIQKKVADIEKLMKELLDEETRKLYEELQKLLNEEQNSEKIQDLLNEIYKKEENLLKELERTLELFKRMKFDYKLEENIKKLEELTQKQDELAEESLDKVNDTDSLSQEQDNLKEDFEDFEKDMEELQELNQDLKNPHFMEDLEQKNESQDQEEKEGDDKNDDGEEQDDDEQKNEESPEDEKSKDDSKKDDSEKNVKEQMEKSSEELKKSKRKKASESQKKTSQKMKKMIQKMQQMQSTKEMQQMETNLNDLRDILHNLIKLSFDQEDLMKDFRSVDQSDPRFVELGQWQLNIRDDAKIVEDSLLSLAERAGQLGSFVTREVSEMNSHFDYSIQAIRDRKKTKAVSEQQFAMTSMNNLALMLDDVMEMMQQNLNEMMGNPGKNSKQMSLSLGELQKQLNKQIEELKRSGKSGRDLSEELAKLAAEQERIRKAMQQMENSLQDGEGEIRNSIAEKMEETEIDLVNKRITAETIERQKEILTRLLEAENAMRERELDNEREGETATQYENELPKAFEDYFKAKEKEIELLKTVPPKLYPYYKKEVNEYFKRIGNQKFE